MSSALTVTSAAIGPTAIAAQLKLSQSLRVASPPQTDVTGTIPASPASGGVSGGMSGGGANSRPSSAVGGLKRPRGLTVPRTPSFAPHPLAYSSTPTGRDDAGASPAPVKLTAEQRAKRARTRAIFRKCVTKMIAQWKVALRFESAMSLLIRGRKLRRHTSTALTFQPLFASAGAVSLAGTSNGGGGAAATVVMPSHLRLESVIGSANHNSSGNGPTRHSGGAGGSNTDNGVDGIDSVYDGRRYYRLLGESLTKDEFDRFMTAMHKKPFDRHVPDDVDAILSVVQQNPFFRTIPPDVCRILAHHLQIEYFHDANLPVYTQGELGSKFYIIASGGVSISVKRKAHSQYTTELFLASSADAPVLPTPAAHAHGRLKRAPSFKRTGPILNEEEDEEEDEDAGGSTYKSASKKKKAAEAAAAAAIADDGFVLGHLFEGDSFGEGAFASIEQTPRTESVHTYVRHTRLLVINRDIYKHLRSITDAETARKKQFLCTRLPQQWFTRCSDNALEMITCHLQTYTYPRGTVLVKQGGTVPDTIFVTRGICRLLKTVTLDGPGAGPERVRNDAGGVSTVKPRALKTIRTDLSSPTRAPAAVMDGSEPDTASPRTPRTPRADDAPQTASAPATGASSLAPPSSGGVRRSSALFIAPPINLSGLSAHGTSAPPANGTHSAASTLPVPHAHLHSTSLTPEQQAAYAHARALKRAQDRTVTVDIGDFGVGDFFGILDVSPGAARAPFSIVATSEVQVYRLSTLELVDALDVNTVTALSSHVERYNVASSLIRQEMVTQRAWLSFKHTTLDGLRVSAMIRRRPPHAAVFNRDAQPMPPAKAPAVPGLLASTDQEKRLVRFAMKMDITPMSMNEGDGFTLRQSALDAFHIAQAEGGSRMHALANAAMTTIPVHLSPRSANATTSSLPAASVAPHAARATLTSTNRSADGIKIRVERAAAATAAAAAKLAAQTNKHISADAMVRIASPPVSHRATITNVDTPTVLAESPDQLPLEPVEVPFEVSTFAPRATPSLRSRAAARAFALASTPLPTTPLHSTQETAAKHKSALKKSLRPLVDPLQVAINAATRPSAQRVQIRPAQPSEFFLTKQAALRREAAQMTVLNSILNEDDDDDDAAGGVGANDEVAMVGGYHGAVTNKLFDWILMHGSYQGKTIEASDEELMKPLDELKASLMAVQRKQHRALGPATAPPSPMPPAAAGAPNATAAAAAPTADGKSFALDRAGSELRPPGAGALPRRSEDEFKHQLHSPDSIVTTTPAPWRDDAAAHAVSLRRSPSLPLVVPTHPSTVASPFSPGADSHRSGGSNPLESARRTDPTSLPLSKRPPAPGTQTATPAKAPPPKPYLAQSILTSAHPVPAASAAASAKFFKRARPLLFESSLGATSGGTAGTQQPLVAESNYMKRTGGATAQSLQQIAAAANATLRSSQSAAELTAAAGSGPHSFKTQHAVSVHKLSSVLSKIAVSDHRPKPAVASPFGVYKATPNMDGEVFESECRELRLRRRPEREYLKTGIPIKKR